LQGLDCSAVICREVADLDAVVKELPTGTVDLIFVPGALRQDPDRPRTEPPEYVRDIQRLAAATEAFVVHTNWPNALNRPEESVEAAAARSLRRAARYCFACRARLAAWACSTSANHRSRGIPNRHEHGAVRGPVA
jgi:sugar phosphate isomerase/epimerase